MTETDAQPDAEPEWWKTFVDELPARTAKLAVVRADGSPQVAPVWIARDGDEIPLSRKKTLHLAEKMRIAQAAASLAENVDEEAIEAAATAVMNASRPIDDVRAGAGYRRARVRVLARRAIENVVVALPI